MAFDIFQREWDSGLLEAVGVPLSIMAEPVQSGSQVGTVSREASLQTSLPEGTIVGAGGHDHVVGALAAGAINPDRMVDSMGTAEALFFPLERPITDPEFARQGYSQGAHVVPDRYYLFGGVYSSSACIEWIRDVFGHASYEELIATASTVPAGSLGAMFLPHLRLSNAPNPDSKSRAAFVGLTSDTGKGELLRAIYEGIAFEARSTIEPALRFAGHDAIPTVIVIGGGSRNEFLLRIKASVLNRPLHVVDLDEATSLGAAMLGGIAAGIYKDHDDATNQVEVHPRTVCPEPADAELYYKLFSDTYNQLYHALKSVNHSIHDAVVSTEQATVGIE